MAGLRIFDMDAADSFDVIHVLMEEDSVVQSREIHASKMEVRSIIYGSLYGDKTWASRRMGGDRDDDMELLPLDPVIDKVDGDHYRATSPKPYIPATDPSRLTAILDAPME